MDLEILQNGSDIRGIAIGDGTNLTPKAAEVLCKAFAKWLNVKNPKIAIGTDSRLSKDTIKEGCVKGFLGMGAKVIDCKMASTPAMFMTTLTPNYMCDGAVMITASHLPKNRNGLKFFTNKGGLEKTDIAQLIAMAKDNIPSEDGGSVVYEDFMKVYSQILVDKVRSATGEKTPLKNLNILVDAGNGAGGFYAKDVLEPLGANTTGSQFLEPDGNFPNHIPNPENEEAMQSIVDAVVKNNADFGIIFDTDVDRAGAVDKGGIELNKNKLIAAISAILIKEYPKTAIVTDSITSDGLAKFIEDLGGVHHRFKRGYKNVINEAIRLNQEGQDCQIAIETSGHAALKENYFLDDGAYLVTRLIIEVARLHKEGKDISSLISNLAQPKESVEFRLDIKQNDFKSYGTKLIEDLFEYAKNTKGFFIAKDNHEGIRVFVDEHKGWFLVRLSLHDPLIPINIESDVLGGTKQIAIKLYDFLKNYNMLDLTSIKKAI